MARSDAGFAVMTASGSTQRQLGAHFRQPVLGMISPPCGYAVSSWDKPMF